MQTILKSAKVAKLRRNFDSAVKRRGHRQRTLKKKSALKKSIKKKVEAERTLLYTRGADGIAALQNGTERQHLVSYHFNWPRDDKSARL